MTSISGGGGDADAAMCAAARPGLDDDRHVLTQRRPAPQPATAGEAGQSAVHERRDFGLVEPHEAGRLDLSEPPALDGLADVAGELGLGQLLLGFGDAKVGKEVAAARPHRDQGRFARCSLCDYS